MLGAGLVLWSTGSTLTLLHPFGTGDLQDGVQGVIMGVGFGVMLMSILGKRRVC